MTRSIFAEILFIYTINKKFDVRNHINKAFIILI